MACAGAGEDVDLVAELQRAQAATQELMEAPQPAVAAAASTGLMWVHSKGCLDLKP